MNRETWIRSPEAFAVRCALISGVAAQGFGLVNVLHNYDSILQQPTGYGAGITSGRWLLTVLGDLSQNVLGLGHNLPLVNGLLFLLLIAVSTGLLVNLLSIRKRWAAGLTGCLMATFPTVCATLAFRFTAAYYGIALLLSVLSAWLADKSRWGIFLSGLCLSCSMGIYQAYPPFTIGLFVLMLMGQALAEDATLPRLIRKGVRYCVCLILGVVLYFVFLKLCLFLYGTTLDTYQGIDSMGKISLSQLPGLVLDAWYSAALFSVRDYCSLAGTPMLKLLWSAAIAVIGVLALAVILLRRPKPLNICFFCLMGLVFPLAINFIVVMAPEGIVYTIMVYSFVLVGIAPLMLLEYLPEGKYLPRLTALILSLIVFYNGYHSNLNYTSLYYANRQVENYFSGMLAQMRMTEGYTPEKTWVFLGDRIDDPKFWNIWNCEPVYGGYIGSDAEGLLNASYSVNVWIQAYLGYETVYASPEVEAALGEDPRVQQMPCWPSQGSIQVVDDYLVVKFQEDF